MVTEGDEADCLYIVHSGEVERLGASRAMVNRLLQDLARGGYIDVSRERIVLLMKLPPKW